MSIAIFSNMFIRRSKLKADAIPHLLSFNTYVAVSIGCALIFDMGFHALYAQFRSNVSFDGWWCRVKAYGVAVVGSMFFYSFLLQAGYRVCRIVFSTSLKFRSFRLYMIATIVQWIIGFVQAVPPFILEILRYLDGVFYCQASPANPLGTYFCLATIYMIPFNLTVGCYIYTMSYVRKRSIALTTINQNASTQRDLLVLKRIVALLVFVATVALPQVVIPVIYMITGSYPVWIVHFGWAMTSFSLALISIVLIFVSPNLRKLWRSQSRVEPILATTFRPQTRRT